MEKCIPLELIKRFDVLYPGAWDEVESRREHNKINNYGLWPEWCYIPMDMCMYIDDECRFVKNNTQLERLIFGQTLATLAAWRISKEIYLMDSDVEQILCEQNDTNIKTEILTKLPYYCFYIKTNTIKINNDIVDGFFVRLDYDPRNSATELRFVYASSDLKIIDIPILLNFDTIQQSIESLYKESNLGSDSEILHKQLDLLNRSLQILLYILADNSDIVQNPAQAKVYKPATHRPSAIRDKFSEIRKWDVGYRIGRTIRAKSESEKNNARNHNGALGSHTSKRPHIRRGHWHNYWTGPRQGERKLVLHWIPPTFIGIRDDGPIVFHDVK